jgi:prophage maintenance system killer protein
MKKEMTIQGNKGEIVLYRMQGGRTGLDVRLEAETLWLTQKQMAELFDTERSVITRHVGNIFTSGELVEKSNVQKMHIAGSDKPVAFYNLDVIISVGYRVNSLRGTQFRIWATQVLKDHLVKGYTTNARRLKELRQSLKLVGQVLDRYDVTTDQARALLRVVTEYSYALDLLDDYDHQRIAVTRVRRGKARGITYEEAIGMISHLREKFGGSALFGKEKDKSLAGSLNAVMQTFEGKDVYPGLEEKAAHLLYFLVKNRSFVDGNKRIAAALFLWFMEKNKMLLNNDGTKRIADNALVAITLLIAESRPQEKDSICKMVVNLINDKN